MADFLTTNYHTHTWRCQHAYGTEREYIEAAIELGIRRFGFSDHIPCPFKDGYVSGIRMTMQQAQEYASCIRSLKREYAGQMEVFIGFEAEYITEFYDEQMRMCHEIGCDYLIMGQHFFRSEANGPYAGTPTDDEHRIREYVDTVIEGMRTGSYCCLAHPDLMNYQGMDSVYEWEMGRLCRELKKLEIPLEINILGMGAGKHYPQERFWKLVSEEGNDVILGLDAHCVEHIRDVDSYYKCLELVDKYNLHLIKELEMR